MRANYPFQMNPEKFNSYSNRGHIFKTENIVDGVEYNHSIEFDYDVLDEHFPELSNNEARVEFLKNIVNSICQIKSNVRKVEE